MKKRGSLQSYDDSSSVTSGRSGAKLALLHFSGDDGHKFGSSDMEILFII